MRNIQRQNKNVTLLFVFFPYLLIDAKGFLGLFVGKVRVHVAHVVEQSARQRRQEGLLSEADALFVNTVKVLDERGGAVVPDDVIEPRVGVQGVGGVG